MHSSSSMDRRALLKYALVLLAVPIAVNCNDNRDGKTTALPAPHPLKQTQMALLSAVCDTIIPVTDTGGAVLAGVPATLNTMLAQWASAQSYHDLTGAISQIDQAALVKTGQNFAKLSPKLQHNFLAGYDKQALQKNTIDDGKAHSPFSYGNNIKDPQYKRLKELIVTLYYMSEIGLSDELDYEHTPGQWRPSVPVTDKTRPAGGGAF